MKKCAMHDDTSWNAYNLKNPTHSHLSSLWAQELITWLRIHTTPAMSILDYGCGFFDLGIQLAGEVKRVDGYDPFPLAREFARNKTNHLSNVTIYNAREDIPLHTYKLIILHSVIQYFESQHNIKDYFLFFKDLLLKESDGTVLITDVMPSHHSLGKDAIDLLGYGLKKGVFLDTFTYLVKAATKPRNLHLLFIDQKHMAEIGKTAGFTCHVFEKNLTPLKERYTCALSINL